MTRWLVSGAGAAGCAVASRLAAVGDFEVTLLEGGPDHGAERGPAGTPALDDAARLVPDLAVERSPGGTGESYAQGWGVGGSSLVNAGVVVGSPDERAVAGDVVPLEAPREIGPVGSAALAASADALVVSLIARNGRRATAADVFLPPHVRKRVRIVDSAPVERVLLRDRRAIGAVTVDGDVHLADRVVLCTGAIATPVILLRSGVDTPGVGERLQDHAGVALAFDLRGEAASISEGAPAIGATVERADRQLLLMEGVGGGAGLGVVIAGAMRIHSEGTVRLDRAGGGPVVNLGQLTDERDVALLTKAAREAIELLRSPAMADVIGEVYIDEVGTPLSSIEHDEAGLRQWAGTHLGGYHHVAGSCRPGAVLDERGGVLGYEHLYVADASSLPGVPLRNPYVATIRNALAYASTWSTDTVGQ